QTCALPIYAFDAGTALVDDGVDRDGRLAGLAVADDQLALAAPDRHHRVDGLETGLHRLRHGFAGDDARRDLLDRRGSRGFDRALAVDRVAERVHHAAEQAFAHRHLEDAPGRLDRVALGDVLVLAQDHRADRILLQVQREPEGLARELEHLAVARVGQAVDADNTVRERDHRADVSRLCSRLEVLDALLDELADFGSLECHFSFPRIYATSAFDSRSSRERTEPSITTSPARITAPPIRVSSTSTARRTSRCSRFFNAATSACFWTSEIGAAVFTVTSTVFSTCAFICSNSSAISGSADTRSYSSNSRRKFAPSRSPPANRQFSPPASLNRPVRNAKRSSSVRRGFARNDATWPSASRSRPSRRASDQASSRFVSRARSNAASA